MGYIQEKENILLHFKADVTVRRPSKEEAKELFILLAFVYLLLYSL